MAYSALDVAKYVINYEHSQGREVSNLRLQKLLYFVQAKVLVASNGNPCFSEDMEAWDFGPVVPEVYFKYKIFGCLDLINREKIPFIDHQSEIMIQGMLEYCGNFPTYQLVEITHQQDPWKNARLNGARAIISKQAIQAYFSQNGK